MSPRKGQGNTQGGTISRCLVFLFYFYSQNVPFIIILFWAVLLLDCKILFVTFSPHLSVTWLYTMVWLAIHVSSVSCADWYQGHSVHMWRCFCRTWEDYCGKVIFVSHKSYVLWRASDAWFVSWFYALLLRFDDWHHYLYFSCELDLLYEYFLHSRVVECSLLFQKARLFNWLWSTCTCQYEGKQADRCCDYLDVARNGTRHSSE